MENKQNKTILSISNAIGSCNSRINCFFFLCEKRCGKHALITILLYFIFGFNCFESPWQNGCLVDSHVKTKITSHFRANTHFSFWMAANLSEFWIV